MFSEWTQNEEGIYAANSIQTGLHKIVDVAWCSNIGLENDVVAAVSHRGFVLIYQRPAELSDWSLTAEIKCEQTPRKVSWNGTILCVVTKNDGDLCQTELYKEAIVKEGEWIRMAIITSDGQTIYD